MMAVIFSALPGTRKRPSTCKAWWVKGLRFVAGAELVVKMSGKVYKINIRGRADV